MIPSCDISKYQGAWQNYPCDIVVMKISGGDDGLYYDSSAASDYPAAVAAGKHVGGYHFIGWTIGANQEASYFVRGMAPKAENDVYALDVESGSVPVPANAPQYVLDMVNYIHSQTGVYPLIYMNLATLNAHDWSAVLALCGLWLADWAVSPQATIPTNHTYVMQQYSDGPNYDHDEWFGTLAQFDAYGYHSSNDPTLVASPSPVTTTTTTTEVAPTATTTTTAPPVAPDTTTTTTTTVIPQPSPPPATTTVITVKTQTFWQRVVQFISVIIKGLFGRS